MKFLVSCEFIKNNPEYENSGGDPTLPQRIKSSFTGHLIAFLPGTRISASGQYGIADGVVVKPDGKIVNVPIDNITIVAIESL